MTEKVAYIKQISGGSLFRLLVAGLGIPLVPVGVAWLGAHLYRHGSLPVMGHAAQGWAAGVLVVVWPVAWVFTVCCLLWVVMAVGTWVYSKLMLFELWFET